MAKERVAFKQHAATYVIVNALFVGIWFVTNGGRPDSLASFWPVWPLLGWGIGLAFHGFNAYSDGERGMLVREEERLREKYRRP